MRATISSHDRRTSSDFTANTCPSALIVLFCMATNSSHVALSSAGREISITLDACFRLASTRLCSMSLIFPTVISRLWILPCTRRRNRSMLVDVHVKSVMPGLSAASTPSTCGRSISAVTGAISATTRSYSSMRCVRRL